MFRWISTFIIKKTLLYSRLVSLTVDSSLLSLKEKFLKVNPSQDSLSHLQFQFRSGFAGEGGLKNTKIVFLTLFPPPPHFHTYPSPSKYKKLSKKEKLFFHLKTIFFSLQQQQASSKVIKFENEVFSSSKEVGRNLSLINLHY